MPEASLTTAILFGMVLGIRHALDADHVIAVTTITSRNKSILRSAMVGLSWGIGHTVTLFAAGFAVLIFKLHIPDVLSQSLEFAVGVVLVLLGISAIRGIFASRAHSHEHYHDGTHHTHSHSHSGTLLHDHRHLRRPLLVGMVHGLAGSGALTLVVLSSMTSEVQGLLFLLLFGAGTIISMLVFSGLIGLPFRFTAALSWKLNLAVQGTAGTISLLFGLYLMWQVGVVDGLFADAQALISISRLMSSAL
jgi:sulfite exporter TauE/SafE